jgi:hypothetical protein
LSSCTIDTTLKKESSYLPHKSGLIFQLRTEHYKCFETRIRREISLRLDWQRKSIHDDRVAREKAREEEAALKKKKKGQQKEEEESATPTTTPASK